MRGCFWTSQGLLGLKAALENTLLHGGNACAVSHAELAVNLAMSLAQHFL